MSDADCFTWHTDQDDTYDGTCGSMVVPGYASTFNKNQPYGFTMKGKSTDTLTLQPLSAGAGNFTFWAHHSESSISLMKFNIESGTFAYRPHGITGLVIGNNASAQGRELSPNVLFTVTGNCLLEAYEITALSIDKKPDPCTQVKVTKTGVFSLTATSVGAAFVADIGDAGSMQIKANQIILEYGSYQTYGTAPTGGYSLDIDTSGAAPTDVSGITASNTTILCEYASKARLQSKNLSLTNTHIRVRDTAAVEVNCDAMTVNNSFFDLSPGSATITINGAKKVDLPFDVKQCPKGMINFIPTGEVGTGSFRITIYGGIQYLQTYFDVMANAGLFAINGAVWSRSPINGWTLTPDYSSPYMVVKLVKA
ncbi:hypothetical protein GCM10011491_28590 [Brucella endophytica]|uniref:Uncharacterized protein n=1 Tax=Brucella endophytica TaxID=1963359 RepID=A0A916WHP1_9HYPH|nr:hypothetical protein [Brucella endophytica]GGA98616.1 hypothetical protein GCM10011491_28590 [Brucella endophytica]